MLQNIYNQKVTILNKLKRTDGITGLDVWYKTELDDVAWYTSTERNAGSSEVNIGTFITVLIPFHDEYLPYTKWKLTGNQQGHYTMSTGDYIVLGEVTEDVTANNIIKVLQGYAEDVCMVKGLVQNYKRYGANIQLRIEGV